ncbi:PAS domain-containing protein [Sporosarcina jeotgali]|uniref:PAS domain-containing protein n=1 Tax=Sporosarcina jeotgali TaxID=3020056 RepID=A0ABZ0KVT5_9BACL|nr:PAS domain-containing protein [Sporosarcina sp. B2O-1]WOV84286.1 PAS domain-containing protein [Sporosarcina sp. B2O-1]
MKDLAQSIQTQLLVSMLDGSRVATLVTDPSQPDNPIIYANRTFETMTGYPLSETIGQNCRFLQGPGTDQLAIQQLRDAIRKKNEITITLKNYKKDGTLFWNRLSVTPVQIEGHSFFIGTQTNVSVEYRQRAELTNKESEIEQLMLPIMTIHDNIAAVSLIGEMSPQRFNLLTQKLSEFVQKSGVDHVIIDITGLYWNHESPLTSLLAVQDVLRLMGAQLYITGISPKVALSLTGTNVSDEQLQTFSSIQQALAKIQ